MRVFVGDDRRVSQPAFAPRGKDGFVHAAFVRGLENKTTIEVLIELAVGINEVKLPDLQLRRGEK